MKTVEDYVDLAEKNVDTYSELHIQKANVYAQLALVAMAQKIYESDHGKD